MSELVRRLRGLGLTTSRLERAADYIANNKFRLHLHRFPKRGGGEREIFEPDTEWHTLLQLVKRALDSPEVHSPHPAVHGFTRKRGILTNASQHLGAEVVLAIDLKDFFPSIERQLVEKTLSRLDLDDRSCQLLTQIVAPMGFLPPGFPTSPLLSNMAFAPTDIILEERATGDRVTYTRYADDLSFSGCVDDDFLRKVERILSENGWELSARKTRFMRRGGPQYVTGLYVGDRTRPHVPRTIKKRVRQELYYMAKYGPKDCYERGFGMHYKQAEGWVRYISHVEPNWGPRLRALLDSIDFSDDYLFWTDPDDWSEILKEIEGKH